MGIHKLEISDFIDDLLTKVEEYIFDESQMTANFGIENKESIKQALLLEIDKLFNEYEIIELKNNYKLPTKEKENLLH